MLRCLDVLINSVVYLFLLLVVVGLVYYLLDCFRFIASWGYEFSVSVCCLLVLCLLSVAVFGCLLGYCIGLIVLVFDCCYVCLGFWFYELLF